MAFEASPSDTVASVKARVEAADDGLRHYQQKLLWSGKQLQSLDATLGSYGMRDDGVYKVYLYRTFPPPDWIPFMLGGWGARFSFMLALCVLLFFSSSSLFWVCRVGYVCLLALIDCLLACLLACLIACLCVLHHDH